MSEFKGKMPEMNKIAAVVLGILAVGTILLEIALTDDQTTKLESALFGILQFIFSIGFAWVIARVSMKAEFIASQKKFAISAFRRIREIHLGVRRLRSRLQQQLPFSTKDTRHELDVVEAIASGVADSIQSSMADWSEVIGEEIVKLERIQELRSECVPESGIPPLPQPVAIQGSKLIYQQDRGKDEEIDNLIASLPYPLQALARAERRESPEELVEELDAERRENGFVEIDGFWDPTFDLDVRSLSPGKKLVCRVGDVAKRVGALMAYDDTGRSVGVITNKLSSHSYGCFSEALMQHVGKSQFHIEIIGIAEEDMGDRHYFKAKIAEYRERIVFNDSESEETKDEEPEGPEQ